MRIVDRTGNKYGKLVAIKRVVIGNRAHYICECDCGGKTTVRSDSLTSGKTKSCGCLSAETAISTHTTHGDSYTRLYRIYKHIRGRCFNKGDDRYHRYGGRGICMCDDWLNDYNKFKTWALANGYSDDISIDRIDNDGNYSPENCRWADAKTQANNRSPKNTWRRTVNK